MMQRRPASHSPHRQQHQLQQQGRMTGGGTNGNNGAIRHGRGPSSIGSTSKVPDAPASQQQQPQPQAPPLPPNRKFPRRRRPKLSHPQQQRQDSSSSHHGWRSSLLLLLQRLRLRKCLGGCLLLFILCVTCVYLGFYLALNYSPNSTTTQNASTSSRLRRMNHPSHNFVHDTAAAAAAEVLVERIVPEPVPDEDPNVIVRLDHRNVANNQHGIHNHNTHDNPELHLRGDSSAAAGTDNMSAGMEFLQQRPSKMVVEPRHPLSPAELTLPEQLIDMRQLNYELPFDNPDGGAWKQGWDLQPATTPSLTDGETTTKLQVFVIPHSHCDPGWIKTFDEYFRQQTSKIITTVIQALIQDARRTFIWAEISYFAWWWDEQNERTRNVVRELLRTGQLEFVTGGWVQPDEANAERYAMEIQLQEGHDWIRQHVGAQYIPQYGWAIDPFGYSPTAAHLWKTYNMTGMLIQRVHYAVKKHLAQSQHLEFFWRQTWDNATTAVDPVNDQAVAPMDIFTHIMPFYSYDVPHTCGPDPAVCCQFDFARIPGVSGNSRCPWKPQPKPVTEHNVAERALLLLDQYRKKAALYRSNAVLIPLGDDFRYMTSREAETQYTNYQQMFDYINSHVPDVQVQFGTLSDYFRAARQTFRGPVPILKGSFFTYSDVDHDYWSGYFTSRVVDKALDRRLERILYAAESIDGASREQLQGARRALSLFQHHDGVTGTAKNHVVEDYAQRLSVAIDAVHEWMLRQAEPLLARVLNDFEPNTTRPCWVSTDPRAAPRNACNASMPVAAYNPLGSEQYCRDMVVPALQFAQVMLPCELPGLADVSTSDETNKFVFDPKTGQMLEPIKEEWKLWKVKKGGAYLFVPDEQHYYNVEDKDLHVEMGGFIVTSKFWNRTIVVRQIPDEFGKLSTVLDFIYETDLQEDNQEWIVRFHADIQSEGFFYTDLNGFNFDTHRFRSDMPIQSQVFPMPTLASIQDRRSRLTILSEHAQGTASLVNSSIDVWLDRRLAQDDNRGLGQGVQDNRPTRTRLRVVLEHDNFESDNRAEFRLTPLGHRMWEELQHPLELFGKHTHEFQDFHAAGSRQTPKLRDHLAHPAKAASEPVYRKVTSRKFSTDTTVIPFVYMVFKRVDYLKRAIETLRKSDFPRDRVPLVISHDGQVPEVVEYVNALKDEFNVVQLFHEFSCYDHNGTFPGDDPKLNEGYKGDTYGNPRESRVTCCKHHFTWILKTVFTMDYFVSKSVDHFLFLEEDYIVAPTIYQAVVNGLNAMHQFDNIEFLGVGLTPTHRRVLHDAHSDAWFLEAFVSGPMTLDRAAFAKLREHAVAYCGYDEYNWDWSFVHMQASGFLPHVMLVPHHSLANHIGMEGGMHVHAKSGAAIANLNDIVTKFYGTELASTTGFVPAAKKSKAFGGWGHPADQQHCMNLLALPNATPDKK